LKLVVTSEILFCSKAHENDHCRGYSKHKMTINDWKKEGGLWLHSDGQTHTRCSENSLALQKRKYIYFSNMFIKTLLLERSYAILAKCVVRANNF